MSITTCKCCDYTTNKKHDMVKHLLTKKHKKNEGNINMNEFCTNSNQITCHCGKIYYHKSSYYRHKKNCKEQIESNTNEDKDEIKDKIDKDQLLINLIKQNSDLQHQIIEMSKNQITTNNQITNNNQVTNISNTSGNTFNLNLFLNETCKNAMNIDDFVSSIKINLEDLENTGRHGYIQGITNIFIKNLSNIEQHMRPLHCTDIKREVLYIKDNDKWEKETNDKPIIKKAIRKVASENIKRIKNWVEKYPDCVESDSKKNNAYLKIVSNSMNGSTDEEGHKNINKIISNLVKEISIHK